MYPSEMLPEEDGKTPPKKLFRMLRNGAHRVFIPHIYG